MALSIEQLRQLSLGFSPQPVNVNGSQTVFVQNNPSDASCLGNCDETSCSVTPTEAVLLDNAGFKQGNTTKVRWDINRTASTVASTQNLTLMSRLGPDNFLGFPAMAAFLPKLGWVSNPVVPGAGPGGSDFPANFTPDGSTIDAVPAGAIVWQHNLILEGGAVLAAVTIRFDNTVVANAALTGAEITLGHLPVDNNNSLITTTVYDPFCDFCSSNNAGNFTTHRYTFNGPTTFRDFVNFEVPNDSVFTIELCYGIINLSNTAAAPANKQWL